MGRRQVPLAPRLDPLDRPSDPPSERERERLLGVDVQLRAESAADVGRDHAELRLGDPQHHRERHARDVRDLRRRPHRQLARGREGLDKHAARLDRVRDQPLLAIPLPHDDVRSFELLVDRSSRKRPRVAPVRAELLVDERRALRERELGIDHDRQRLVVDLHQLGSVACGLAALRDDDRNTVADIAGLVHGERPMVRLIRVLGREPRAWKRRVPLVSELVTGERCEHSAVRERAATSTSRIRACAYGLRTTLIQTMPGRLMSSTNWACPVRRASVLLASDRSADDLAELNLGSSRHRQTSTTPAAACTARTMLW